jgi:hypothetical protein
MAAAAASESLLQRLVINLQAVCMRFKDKLALDKVRRCVGGGGDTCIYAVLHASH